MTLVGGIRDTGKDDTLRVIDPRTNTVVTLPLAKQLAAAPYLIDVSIVGAFPPKRVDGDFTRENHEWLSALIQSDWLGGGQLNEAQESSTLSRFEGVATTATQFPHQMTLLPKVNVVTLAAHTGPCRVLGDLKCAWDKPLSLWGAYNTTLTNLGTSYPGTWALSAAPNNSGVAFRGSQTRKRLFIPCGSSGYHVFDPENSGSELDAISTAVRPLCFAEFDRALYALEVDGTIKQNRTGAAADWTTVLQLDGDGDAKGLEVFFNQAGEPCLFAITTRDLYAIDPSVPSAYPTSAKVAPHPHTATAIIKWNEQIWFSHGVDIGRYDGSTISYVGLSRDTGLPPEFRGKIVSMASGWNDLFVLIEGTQTNVGTAGRLETDIDGDLLVGQTKGRSCLMRLDRNGGWHSVWVDNLGGTELTNCYVSATEGEYRLYWGWQDQFNYIDLGWDFGNPAVNPSAEFQTEGELLSSWFDMDYTSGEMILVSLEVGHGVCTPDTTITLSYQIDNEDATNTWTVLGTIDGAGDDNNMTKYRIGTHDDPLPNGNEWFDGRYFHRVRYRVQLKGTVDATPVLKWISLLYMKKMGTVNAFTATVDCTSTASTLAYGMSNQARQQLLEDLIELAFVPVCYRGDEWRMVKFAGANGPDATGQRFAGDRQITMIEAFAL